MPRLWRAEWRTAPVRHRRHHSEQHASPAALYRYGDGAVCKTAAFGSVCSIHTRGTIVASSKCLADQPSARRDDDKGFALLRVVSNVLPLGGDRDKTQLNRNQKATFCISVRGLHHQGITNRMVLQSLRHYLNWTEDSATNRGVAGSIPACRTRDRSITAHYLRLSSG